MYEIADPAPLPSRPDLPGTVVLRATADEAIDAAAADLMIHAVNCARSFGDFHVAVATGPGAEPLLRRLMYDPACRELPWQRVHLWLLDELFDPSPGAERRAADFRELVVIPSGIPENQVHEIDPTLSEPDAAYEARIREHLGWREKGHDRLDYVLIGADADGPWPTGSARPGRESQRLVAVLEESGSPRRISMTRRLVAASRFVGVMALGERARPFLRSAAARDATRLHPDDPRRLLLDRTPPVGGELRWYMDTHACPGAGEAAA